MVVQPRSFNTFDVVILAGGECKRMYPLTSGVVKALLPVANRPLLSYSLQHLAEAGVRSALVVATGESAAASITAYLSATQQGAAPPAGSPSGGGPPPQAAAGGGGGAAAAGATPSPAALVRCEVVQVAEEAGTADALRAVAGRITSDTCVVYSADLLSEVPLQAVVATHHVHGALATVVVGQRRTSPATETKPGKAPKGVDYLGLDSTGGLLLWAASSPEALRDLTVPLAVVARHDAVTLRSDLVDMHLYVFSRRALDLLTTRPALTSLKLDFLPALARQQLRLPPPTSSGGAAPGGGAAAAAAAAASAAAAAAALSGDEDAGGGGLSADGRAASVSSAVGAAADAAAAAALPGAGYMALSHTAPGRRCSGAGAVCAYRVRAGSYCARVNSVQSYGEVNREVAAPDTALQLTGWVAGKHDNVVAPGTALGHKATVGPACVVGPGCVIGDKTSVKRSVIGEGCRLGASVKVINSVLMDGVTIGDGAHIQNCVLCARAAVQERSSLRDCQVGPAYVVGPGSEHKEEVLAKT